MRLLLLVLLVSFNAQAASNFERGSDLYQDLQAWKASQSAPADEYAAGSGVGYVIGVLDSVMGTTIRDVPFCLDPKVSSSQLIEIVYLYLKDHPDERQNTAASIVEFSITEAFPCK